MNDHYETENPGIYQFQGILRIPNPNSDYEGRRRNYTYGGSYHARSRARGSIRFVMEGFWSENSRKLCMVGSATYADDRDKLINFDAVLKLKFASVTNPTVYTSVVSGTLESAISDENDARYFDPISMFSFPDIPRYSYNYSIVSNELGKEPISSDYDKSLKLESNQFCSVIGWRSISMEMKCGEEEEQHWRYSPARFLFFSPIDNCYEGDGRFRFLLNFQNSSYGTGIFSRESTLIGEAVWDDENNVLLGAACTLLDPLSHFGDAVGDCTMRLSWRYPSIVTIRNDSKIVGRFWSSKAVDRKSVV